MRGFLKWLNLSSVFSLPMRLLMALVLALVSNVVSADLSCGNNTNSGNARCKQIASGNGYPDGRWNIQSKAGYPSTSMSCMGSALSGAKYELGWFSCSGSCNNGVVPTIANGYSCDAPPDDCSADLATMGADLSGSNMDGSCACPAGKETLNAGTSSVSCADPCAVGTHRLESGACADNCTGGFAWNESESYCECDGYPGEVNGLLTCIKATNSQLGSIEQNTADTKAGIDSIGAKQDATNQGITNIQNQNTTIINGQAQQLSAMGATAASAASTATSSAAGAASSATTASNTASISAATQATNIKLDTTNAGLADLAAGIGTANQSLTAIKGSLSGTVTQGEQGTFTAPTSEEENVLRTALNAKYTEISGGLTQIFTPPVLEGNSGLPCYRNIPLFDDYDFDICLSDYEDEMSIIPAFIYGFGIFLAAFIVIGGAKND